MRYLPGVHFDGPQTGRKEKFAADVRSEHGQVARRLQQLRDSAKSFDRRTAFGEGEELAGHLLGAQAGLLRFVEPLLHRPLGGDHFRQRNIAENAGQNVVEIMGDAAGEQAERFQFAGLVQFDFQLPILRDVATDERDSGDAAGRVMDRRAAGHDHSLPTLP